ncbi:HEPN domain-containing protein [Parabacteroides sp. OttesenSCG-928-G07]|nr:HEPN domain-containing protein [Parabacteroides sp. OttesenSCG-928-G07]
MKRSISFLPKNKQHDLYFIVSLIRKRLPQVEMIILYGSYARNEYVDYDERIEFGIRTEYRSDYDILVVTRGISDKDAGKILDNIDDQYYQDPEKQTPVQFINEDIHKLNHDLSEGRYFYTQIKQEGIILYDSCNFKLARRRKLRFDEIKQQAEEYFQEKFQSAGEFLDLAKIAAQEKMYKKSAFLLHQTCENYYYAINLVFTLKNNKQHNLSKLSSSVKRHSVELLQVFPRHSEEEKRLFNLIKAAYVEARYNPDFKVTKEDFNALVVKVELLRDITQRICLKRINDYASMITSTTTYIRVIEISEEKLGEVADIE